MKNVYRFLGFVFAVAGLAISMNGVNGALREDGGIYVIGLMIGAVGLLVIAEFAPNFTNLPPADKK